jgi:hypothetical protein
MAFENLYTMPNSVKAGDIVANYGSPCLVQLARFSGRWRVTLLYPNLIAEVSYVMDHEHNGTLQLRGCTKSLREPKTSLSQ